MRADTSDGPSVAAALFRAAARSPADVDDGARLLCLAAASHLDQPPPAWPQLTTTDPAATIHQALATLAALPLEQFSATAVLNAAAAGRQALSRLP